MVQKTANKSNHVTHKFLLCTLYYTKIYPTIMKFWFIYTHWFGYLKCSSFDTLVFYNLKFIAIKTLEIIPTFLSFKTESSAQSHKVLSNKLGLLYHLSSMLVLPCFVVLWGPLYRYSQWKCHISIHFTFVSSLQGEGHVQLQHFLLVNQTRPIPLDLSPVSKNKNSNIMQLSGNASATHRGLWIMNGAWHSSICFV